MTLASPPIVHQTMKLDPFGLKVPEAFPSSSSGRVLLKSLCTAHVLLTKNLPSYPKLCAFQNAKMEVIIHHEEVGHGDILIGL